MKHNLNRVLSVVALLMLSLSTWASGEVTISVVPANAGTVTSDISGGVCTLTATPAQGYYLTAANLQAVTILNGEAMQAPRRAIPINDGVLAISATNADADPSGVTTYTFTMPDENFTVEVTAEFQRRISISDATITLAESSCTYDGTAKEPAVSQVMVGNTALTANDYTVSYSDNISVGTSATVTLTGQGMYLGTATTTFTISAKAITSDMITLTSSSLVYTAEANIPEVTVTDQIGGENVRLSAGTDYTVSYQQVVGETASARDNPIDVGSYNVVVTGKGNYTGSATKSFAITKAPLENLSVSIQGWTYGAQASEPVVEGNEGEGGETFYFKAKNADDSKYSEVVPENAGDYTLKVVVAETDNYASGSATADFTISKAYLTVEGVRELTVSITGWKYGAEHAGPTVSGNLGNADVTYTYKDGKDDQAEFSVTVPTTVGSYIVKATVAESDNYFGGEAYNEFSIEKGDIPTPTVSTIDGQTYDGQAHNIITVSGVPTGTTVKYYYAGITASDYNNESFELLCEPGEDEFSATVPTTTDAGYFALLYRIDGGDNYNDIEAGRLIKVAFVPASISEVTIDKTSMEYTGEAQTVTITSVKAGNLVLGTNDYTVKLNDVTVTGNITAKDVNEYTVAVTGQGNFTGTGTADFSIVNHTLADNEVEFYNQWATYYSADGDVMLPSSKTIGAYVATSVGDGVVTVSQISYIPEGVAVLLNNATETVATEAFDVKEGVNLMKHATTDVDTDTDEALFYGLHNGTMMRVSGTIPAGKNYLMVSNAVVPGGNAPKLTIVFDNEATGVNSEAFKEGTVY